MAKVSDLFQSRFLRADDLGDHRVKVTIDQVRVEPLHGGRKPVLYFRGKSKGLILNATRARALATILGTEETDEWIGSTVTLYADGATVYDEHNRARRVRMICVDAAPRSGGDHA
jgi:hypothetical protein